VFFAASRSVLGANLDDDLHKAAQHGDLFKVRMLLEQGANIDSLDKNGKTALQLAADEQNRCFKVLHYTGKVDCGKIRSWNGIADLLRKVSAVHDPVIDTLLESGASVKGVSAYRATHALVLAVSSGNDSLAARRVAEGASTTEDSDLISEAGRALSTAAFECKDALVGRFLDYSFPIRTPIHRQESVTGSYISADLSLSVIGQPDANFSVDISLSPVSAAVFNNCQSTVKLLLDRGVGLANDVAYQKASYRVTTTVSRNEKELVNFDISPLGLATLKKNRSIVEFLLERGARTRHPLETDPLIIAALQDDADILGLLLSRVSPGEASAARTLLAMHLAGPVLSSVYRGRLEIFATIAAFGNNTKSRKAILDAFASGTGTSPKYGEPMFETPLRGSTSVGGTGVDYRVTGDPGTSAKNGETLSFVASMLDSEAGKPRPDSSNVPLRELARSRGLLEVYDLLLKATEQN